MTKDHIRLLQTGLDFLGYNPGKIDGLWGPKTQKAFNKYIDANNKTFVLASSFADPADVRAFRKCKAKGKTDQECFKVGDNGIGKWGDDTTVNIPMCALPPEDWGPLGDDARGSKVRVQANGKEVICELRDTMPAVKNIKNGARIDLNQAAVVALGLKPPILIPANWNWV